jgi:tripartite-type tricarboxylate transporter receptor subunit TctC
MQKTWNNRRAFVLGAALSGCGAPAPSVQSFPSGDITFIIPNAPGGGADLYVRLLGAAIERRMPNRINVVPRNVAAGGGGKGVTQLFRAAPDGRTIGSLSIPGVFVLQRLRRLPHDFSRFTWVGALTQEEHYGLAVSRHSPIQTIADLTRLSAERELTFGATGPEATAYAVTIISARLLGLRARLVTGYGGSNDYVFGAVRGDTDAVVTPVPIIRRMRQWLRPIATFEEVGSLPAVPDARALGRPELTHLTAVRVIAAPPGVPNRITAALGRVLSDASSDRDIVAWAEMYDEKLKWRSPADTAALVSRKRDFFERQRSVVPMRA